MKKCKVCGAAKPFDEFHKDKTGEGGVRNVCKICRLFSIRQERRSQKPKKRKKGKTKMCSKCEVEKHVSEFYKDNGRKDKLTVHCKECMDKARKELRKQEFDEYKKIPKWYREVYL